MTEIRRIVFFCPNCNRYHLFKFEEKMGINLVSCQITNAILGASISAPNEMPDDLCFSEFGKVLDSQPRGVNVKQLQQPYQPDNDEQEGKTWKELGIITEWLNDERIGCLSSSEKTYFRFCRDINFDKPFAVVLKNRFPQLWNRLLGEAIEYLKQSPTFQEEKEYWGIK